MYKFSILILLAGLLSALLVGCNISKTDETAEQQTDNPVRITAFIFYAAENDSLNEDVVAEIDGSKIAAVLPYGSDLTALKPHIEYTSISILPLSGEVQDFSKTVSYQLLAEDSDSKSSDLQLATSYDIILNAASSLALIQNFSFLASENNEINTDITATIEGYKIFVIVPTNTNRTSLLPTISFSGESILPENNSLNDFTLPVTYTVSASGFTQNYTVIVLNAKSTDKWINSFGFEANINPSLSVDVTGDISGDVITVTLPFQTDRTHLRPTIQLTGEMVAPGSGVERDFTLPQTYTVFAADNSSLEYTVTVTSATAIDKKEILSFDFLAQNNPVIAKDVIGVINGFDVSVDVPSATATQALIPTIAIDGYTITPASGQISDFSSPLTFVVRAEDDSTQDYRVTITGNERAIPGTELTVCTDLSADIACPVAGAPMAQNGSYTHNAPSYDDATNDIILDNITGLMWQKNADLVDTLVNGITYCETLDLQDYSDWRVPFIHELHSLFLPGPGPKLHGFMSKQFSGNDYTGTKYWSRSYSSPAQKHLQHDFRNAPLYSPIHAKSNSDLAKIRCVRGGAPARGFTWVVDNPMDATSDQTVSDQITSLQWQREDAGAMKWLDALNYCESLTLNSEADWRLPNLKELFSIATPKEDSCAIDETKFLLSEICNPQGYPYGIIFWSSTPSRDNPRPNGTYTRLREAWTVNFETFGFRATIFVHIDITPPSPDTYDTDGKTNLVRCVRGGY